MKKIILSFLFFHIHLFVNGKQICQNQTVSLEPAMRYFFFETPNFPSGLIDVNFKCSINVNLENAIEQNDTEKIGMILTYVMFPGQISPDALQYFITFEATRTNESYIFNSQNYNHFIETEFVPFQGLIYYDDWNDDDCPFESLSRIDPFNITDETQIIYIRSSYFENDLREHNCRWRFVAPEGYGFKVVIIELNLIGNSSLTVQNSTDYYIVRENHAKLFHPYYNSDNHLNIFLSKNTVSNATVKMEFATYITIIKNNAPKVKANCTTEAVNSEEYNWINSDGYPNNAKCVYNLSIFSGTEIVLEVGKLDLEAAIDSITYNDLYGNINFLQYLITMSDIKLVFEPFKNDTIRQVQFVFLSDGSVQGQSFRIVFWKIYCTCGMPIFIVPCDGNSLYFITNTTEQIPDYCGNMKCNFTIKTDENCKNKLIAATVNLYHEDLVFQDIFLIISNNHTSLNITKSISQQMAILHPKDVNIFVARTFSSLKRKEITITLSTLDDLKTGETLTITEDFLYQAVETNSIQDNTVFMINVSSNLLQKNAFIEVFSSLSDLTTECISLYTNNNLIYEIDNNCFVEEFSYLCQTNRSQISVYRKSQPPNIPPPILLFQLTKDYRKGCIFENNVIELIPQINLATDVSYSAISTTNENCRIFILSNIALNLFIYKISSFWTTAKENVKIYTGIKEKQQIMEFNSDTASQWREIILFSEFYMIELPSNCSMIIFISLYPTSPEITIFRMVPLLNTSYASVITTPYNGENQISVTSYWNIFCFANIRLDERPLEFFILHYNVPPSFHFNLKIDSVIQQNFSKVGDTLTVKNGLISLCYAPTTNDDGNVKDYAGVTLIYKAGFK